MLDKIAPYWKAVVGFIAPGAIVITSAVLEGSDGGSAITGSEWILALCSAVITSAGVYAFPNRPAGSPVGRQTPPAV
jgi:hypothetical protein